MSGRKCDKPRHHPPGDVWVCFDGCRSRSDLLLGLVRRGRSGKLFQGKLELQLFPHNSDVRGRFDSNPNRCRADSQNGDSNIVSDSHGLACFSRQHQHRRSLSMRWPTIAHLEGRRGLPFVIKATRPCATHSTFCHVSRFRHSERHRNIQVRPASREGC